MPVPAFICNSYFHDLVNKLDGKLFNADAIFKPPVDEAFEYIQNQLKKNPNSNIFLLGYSAGGHGSIKLAEMLDEAGIKVKGLVTFDPHSSKRLAGYKKYKLPSNIESALNFTQQNKRPFFKPSLNPFKGGTINCNACTEINYTGQDVNHNNIVDYSLSNYREQIYKTLGREL